MSRDTTGHDRPTLNPLARNCFGIAALAMVGSFTCAIINSTLSGWMAVAGMAGLGLFYLALGVLNLGQAESPASHQAHGVTSRDIPSHTDRDSNSTSHAEQQPESDELIEV